MADKRVVVTYDARRVTTATTMHALEQVGYKSEQARGWAGRTLAPRGATFVCNFRDLRATVDRLSRKAKQAPIGLTSMEASHQTILVWRWLASSSRARPSQRS